MAEIGIQLEHMRKKVDRGFVIGMRQESFAALVKEGYGDLLGKMNSQSEKVQKDTWLRLARKALIQQNT